MPKKKETWIDWEENIGVFRDPNDITITVATKKVPLRTVVLRLRAMDLFYCDLSDEWLNRVITKLSKFGSYVEACKDFAQRDPEVSRLFAEFEQKAIERHGTRGKKAKAVQERIAILGGSGA